MNKYGVKIDHCIAQQIIDAYLLGATYKSLGIKFNLRATSVGNIVRGDTWKTCKRPDNIREIISDRADCAGFQKGRVTHADLPPLTPVQHEVLAGSLLGDGSVCKSTANCGFIKPQSCDRKPYLEWHFDILKPYSSIIYERHTTTEPIAVSGGKIIGRRIVPKRLSSFCYQTVRHPAITEYRRKWYPDGVKIIPYDLKLTPQTIAVWYWDDGSNNERGRFAVFCTQCFTFDEAHFLVSQLKDFDIKATIHKKISPHTGKSQPLLRVGSHSYDNLINLVKPFMFWDCFQHKINWRPSVPQWQSSGKFNPTQIAGIIKLRESMSVAKIATLYGVHKETIRNITTGKSWLRQRI